MGNEQSVPNRRLSKPRTTSSGNLLSQIVPKTPSRHNSQTRTPSKSRYSLFSGSTPSPGPDPEEPVPVEDGQEPRRRRRDLFRSRSSQAKSRTRLDDPVIPTEDVPTPVELPVRRYSVNSNLTYAQPTHDFHTSRQVENRDSENAIDSGTRPTFNTRASLQHVPYPGHNSRLSLVAEVHSPLPEPGEFTRRSPTRRYSLYNQESDVQVPTPRLSLSSRTNSDITNYGPIRRRSLLQPGIVTRKPVVGNDCRQSLPSQRKSSPQLDEKLQRLSYDSKSRNPPVHNYDLPSLEPAIRPSSPNQRVQTPNSLDYGHIGDFKLGTLRITNGLASPTPSDKTRPITAKDEEDYLTNGGEYKETNRPPRPSRRSNTLPSDTIIAPWVTVRPASPLRHVQRAEKGLLTIETRLPLPDSSLSQYKLRNKQSPNKSDPNQEDTEDMIPTPFSFDTSPMSSGFQVTSKNTAMEDDLFETETDAQPETAELVRTGASSYDSGYGSNDSPLATKSSKDDLSPKSLEKADSGYSSNLSLRSFNKNQNAPMVPAKDSHMLKVSRIASNTNSVSSASVSSTLSSKRSLKTLLQGKLLSRKSFESNHNSKETSPAPVTPQKQAPASPSTDSITLVKTLDVFRPNVPPKSESRMQFLAQQKHKRQQSLPNQALPNPQLKSSSSGELGNKIQKRPQIIQTAHSEPVYTVQAMPGNKLSAPPVPQDTERHLEERVDAFPGAAFPNTFNRFSALRKSSSKETLGTIFSVGSAEVREEINFARLQGKLPAIPSPIAEIPSRKPAPKQEIRPRSNRRATIQPASNPVPTWKSVEARRRPSWTRSRESIVPPKSAEEEEEEFEAQVTSFDAISFSLGKSPYDLACVANAITRPASTGAVVRARSSTEMFEAGTAERLQRRAVSEQTQSSATLQNRHSFGSMKTSHHVSSGPPGHVRTNSREVPPPAHNNRSSWKTHPQKPQEPPTSISEGGGIPIPAREMRQRKPPVSMQTQGKMSRPRAQSNGQPTPSPSSSDRRSPQPSFEPKHPPPRDNEQEDHWATQKNFWAERRKSAGEALSARQSMELSRPGSIRTRASPSPSMEAQREKMAQGMGIPRASSARADVGGWGNSKAWSQVVPPRVLPEGRQPKRLEEVIPYQPWTGHSTGSHRNFSPSSRWQEMQSPSSYHHTYGSESQAQLSTSPSQVYYPQSQPPSPYHPPRHEGYYPHQTRCSSNPNPNLDRDRRYANHDSGYGAYDGYGYGYEAYEYEEYGYGYEEGYGYGYGYGEGDDNEEVREVVRSLHGGRMGTGRMMALEGWEVDGCGVR
ncbi:hypothetical protein HYALB_00010749 [Hymenoscyphus albidus]|uniref:Proteophosphoglycan ppg4 n=1 Tax=Hymenoscyphus albidus TaxID=595503 RepID=A0A9N9PTL5_9HELO|nr:hypothetical protein HYALB_00010749 [Hymenoscyphus albidus]